VLKKNALAVAGSAAKATMDKTRHNLKRTLTSLIGYACSFHKQQGRNNVLARRG